MSVIPVSISKYRLHLCEVSIRVNQGNSLFYHRAGVHFRNLKIGQNNIGHHFVFLINIIFEKKSDGPILHEACEIIQFCRRRLKILSHIFNIFMKYIFIYFINWLWVSKAKDVKHVFCYGKTHSSLKNVYVPYGIIIFKTGSEVFGLTLICKYFSSGKLMKTDWILAVYISYQFALGDNKTSI